MHDRSKFSPCVGCGYCCLKSPCEIAFRKYDLKWNDRCPALYWDEVKKRYFCDAYDFELWLEVFGFGCPSNLNTWRKEVKERG